MTRSHPDMFQQTEWAGATGKPNGAAHENSVGKRRRRKVKGGLDELIIANADAAIEPDAAPPVEETTEPDANAAVDEDDLIKDPDARRAVGDGPQITRWAVCWPSALAADVWNRTHITTRLPT
jgi:hypothetical protein